jgi:hypothetical protein
MRELEIGSAEASDDLELADIDSVFIILFEIWQIFYATILSVN